MLAMCIACAGVTACDQVLPSTGIKAYAVCVKQAKMDGALNADTIRGFCADKYQKALFVSDAQTEGHATPSGCSPEPDFSSDENLALPRTCSLFGGDITNKTQRNVITSVTVTVTNKKTKIVDNRVVDHLWIEPKATGDFSFSLDHPFNQKRFGETLEFDWSLSDFKGIDIDY